MAYECLEKVKWSNLVGVGEISDEDISAPPKVMGTIPGAYLMGIGMKNNKKALLINIEKVIMDDDLNSISEEVKQWKKQN